MTLQTEVEHRARDASRTRQLLLESARRRFAYDGYAATKVRDIASDAGVNVALINRYFGNKEGLFAACLSRAVEDLDRGQEPEPTFDAMVSSLVERVASLPSGEHPLELLLLIRSSGDDQADRIRLETLNSYTDRMAAIAGWRTDDASTEHLRLKAQIALATAFGIVLLRASTRLEPLTSVSQSDLSGPLGQVIRSLLSEPGNSPL